MTVTAAPDLYARPHGTPIRNPYDFDVAKRELMGIQELRLHLKTVVDLVLSGTHVVFTRHNKRVAVLVPMDWYRKAAESVGEPTEY